MHIVDTFLENFQKIVSDCPIVDESFYSSFEYTRTGNNLSHSRTLGLIVKACLTLPEIEYTDIDTHLNEGKGIKFQPDVAALNKNKKYVLFIDFESPNSSDARIPSKDVEPFAKWIDYKKANTPYLIITSLPRHITRIRPSIYSGNAGIKLKHKWELRYTSLNKCNYGHKQFKDQIMMNPFKYWYDFYQTEIKRLSAAYPNLVKSPLYFANLDGLQVEKQRWNLDNVND